MTNRSRVSAAAALPWPALHYVAWRDTAATLQRWTQIVGKVRLALTPWLNHGWHVPLYVTARGLGTVARSTSARRARDRVRFRRAPPRLRSSAGPRARLRAAADVGRGLLSAPDGRARRGRHRGGDRRRAERGRRADRRSPTTKPRRYDATPRDALLARPGPGRSRLPSLSHRASSARRARCISSGAASTSPSRASRAGARRCIRAAFRACPTRSRARPIRTR